MNDLKSDLFPSSAASEGDSLEGEESEHGKEDPHIGGLWRGIHEPTLLCSAHHTSNMDRIFHS